MQRFESHTPEETEALGEKLAGRLAGGQFVAFTGGLGAGKTTFCRGLARGLGCLDPVSSPTFAVVNLYRGPTPLAHFDAYRVTAPQDLEAAGFYDYLEGGAVVAMEWSENVAEWLQPPDVKVGIAPRAAGGRTITIEGVDWL